MPGRGCSVGGGAVHVPTAIRTWPGPCKSEAWNEVVRAAGGSADPLEHSQGDRLGAYSQNRRVSQRLIVYWKRREKEPWFLATDLECGRLSGE